MFKFNQFIKKHWFFISVLLFLFIWMVHSYLNHGIFFSIINYESQGVLDFINSFGVFSYLVFVLIVIFEVVLAPVPPFILYIVAGLLFGGFYAGILVLLGNLIGAYIAFKISRKLIGKEIERKIDKRSRKKFDKHLKKYGVFTIFILRVNPLTSSDLVSYLAGLTNMKTIKFLIATALGLAPLVFLQTYLGGSLIQGNPFLMGITVFFSILYLCFLAYIIILLPGKKHAENRHSP